MLKSEKCINKSTFVSIDKDTLAAYENPYFWFAQKPSYIASGFIITAWNPQGLRLGQRQNRLHTQRLAKRLAGFDPHWGFGGNQEMSYRERSALVRAPRSYGKKLMKEFSQNAIYLIKGGRLSLYFYNAQETPVNGDWLRRVSLLRQLPRRNYAIGFDTPQNASF